MLGLALTGLDLFSKFEVSSFMCSKDVMDLKFKKVTWHWPRPFLGWLVIFSLGIAVDHICAKFESISTGYRDMKGSTKGRKWGGFG